MPAHRSTDEGEIRDAVVARLRLIRPDARIIHEIQSACQGPNRFDLIAVSGSEIIAVEVKSKKDKLDRLPAQITAMRGSAHHVIAALHEKFLPTADALNLKWSRDGSTRHRPPQAKGATVWAYPETIHGRYWDCGKWEKPDVTVTKPLPTGALDMLWQAELVRLCTDLGQPVTTRATRPRMINLIRWNCPGGAITKGVCAALRRRACIEADPVVDADAQVAA